jgi:secondary thiamine-phosphate synthase enzyme
MRINTFELTLKTTSETDVIDLTRMVSDEVSSSGVETGCLLLFVPGSTGALTTIEYESGVLEDLKKAIERMAPEGIPYAHDRKWGDGNGYSHVRAALVGPSLNIPILDGSLALGTWQQIVLLDFDNRSRKRYVIGQVIGLDSREY